VIRAWLDSTVDQLDTHQHNLAFNVGGSVMYSLSKRIGVRGDLRYLRARGRLVHGLRLLAHHVRGSHSGTRDSRIGSALLSAEHLRV
jgi:hypothetical protein